MASIALRALRKTFPDNTVAVHDFDLDIADGEFLTLLGPSGCGKSTTLRMIAGLDAPSAGAILFDGANVERHGPAQRNVAMVFQNYALYPHMTVRGNLDYPLRKRGIARAERASRVAATALTLRLGPLLDRRPRQLSGGQQQRVALGRAMIRNPSVFLFDEPLSNLDAQLRTAMRAELVRIHAETRCTTVYVTHDQLEAMTMSDRIAVMHEGTLQQVGTPYEIYHQPANRFVAGFVGTPPMNLFSADLSILSGCGLMHLEASGLVVGIRPEHVTVSANGRYKIARVEPTGHETLLTVPVGGVDIVARLAANTPLRTGMAVSVTLDEAHVHLFDEQSGLRLAKQERPNDRYSIS